LPISRRAPYLITEFLAIGPCHGAGGPSVDNLARLGFRHIIDLNADPSEKALSRRAEVSYYPVGTDDEFSVGSWVTNVQEAVSIITRAEQHKEKVYLHCTYGLGRSPTIAMAYLVSKNFPVQAAIEHVKKSARQVWNEGNPVSKYKAVLQAYANSVGKHR
jgi:protein-tyrosine phosphatase